MTIPVEVVVVVVPLDDVVVEVVALVTLLVVKDAVAVDALALVPESWKKKNENVLIEKCTTFYGKFCYHDTSKLQDLTL